MPWEDPSESEDMEVHREAVISKERQKTRTSHVMLETGKQLEVAIGYFPLK